MSIAVRPDRLSVEELERRVRGADPGALLVPPRILRRVVKRHQGLGGLGLRVPHRKSYLIDRNSLLQIAPADDLGLPPDAPLPHTVLLLPRPEPAHLDRAAAPQVLRSYWRLLFHARVHRELRRRGLDEQAVRDRVGGVGAVAFEEARAVLSQESYLFPGADTAAVYEEFAAVYLELRAFDPHHLPYFFPAAEDREAIDRVLARDLDAEEILRSTRPEGAGEPEGPPPEPPEPPEEGPPAAPESAAPGELRARAEAVSRRGNQVRAAILRVQASRRVPPSQAGSLRGPARREMELLAAR